MNLHSTQKPLSLIASALTQPLTIVAVPCGTKPDSVITATYDIGLSQPFVSNKAGNIGALSPIDGTSQKPTDYTDKNISATESLARDFLVRVGECANCSSDLYADKATAVLMTEHAHYGSCVLCGGEVAYLQTEEVASIAIDVEREELDTIEIADNYFDFTELNTVDPNTVRENDMSNNQARDALRANVAREMANIIAQAQKDDSAAEVVVAEDEGDFASDSEGEDSSLEVMDMDETDPSEETEDEEDSTSSSASESDEENASTKIDSDDVSEDMHEELIEDQMDSAVEDDPADVPEVEMCEDENASTDTLVDDSTTIEYNAGQVADISPKADLVPVGETAYYIVQDDAPVAILRKENASAGVQSIWNKPVAMRETLTAALSGNSDKSAAFNQLGGKILTHSTTVAKVVAQRIEASEAASAKETAAERSNYTNKLRQSLEVAGLGIAKGMFGIQYANPVASELSTILEVNGVRNPKEIITASMIQTMPKLVELVLNKALELADESDAALSSKAELVGNSDFINPVILNVSQEEPATPAAPAPAPVQEMASAKPKIDISRLFGGVGRSLHS